MRRGMGAWRTRRRRRGGRRGRHRQAQHPALRDRQRRRGVLAIAWCLRNPHVSSVILGASRVEQLLQNLEALTLLQQADEALWARVEAAAAA